MRGYNRSYPVHNSGVEIPLPVHNGYGVRSPYWSQQADRIFYVSVIDGKRKAILLGPYETHQEAIDQVPRGRDLAEKAGASAFYYFGTCSSPRSRPLRPAFGS